MPGKFMINTARQGAFHALCVGLSVAGTMIAATPRDAAAADINYAEVFKTRALKCLHPTVDPSKTTVEVTKGPEQKGEMTTVRFKVFYPGLMKKDSMEAELLVRQAGSIRQMKVNVLADSSSVHKGCDLEKNWQDF